MNSDAFNSFHSAKINIRQVQLYTTYTDQTQH